MNLSKPGNEERIMYELIKELRIAVMNYCKGRDCKSCPFEQYIDKDAAFLPVSCPLRVHAWELVNVVERTALREVVDPHYHNCHLVDWIDTQKVFIKGFDENLECRGMQYATGETFSVEGPVSICENGLHFCANWLEVFDYYPPPWSRWCYVTVPEGASVDLSSSSTTKRCASSIEVQGEMDLAQLIMDLPEERGYKEALGPWTTYDTLTVDKEYALVTVNTRVCSNRGRCSTVMARADVAIADWQNAAVVTDEERGHVTAIANNSQAVAWTRGVQNIAIAQDWRAIALTTGVGSISIANYQETTAIVRNEWSYGIGVVAGGSFVRLEADYGIALSAAHTVVTGKHCTVIIPYKYNKGSTSVKAPEGSTVIFWPEPVSDPVVWKVGKDSQLKPDTEYGIMELLLMWDNYKKETKE